MGGFDWGQILSDHGLAVFLVLCFVVVGAVGGRTVWRYITGTLIPNCFRSLEGKIEGNGEDIKRLGTKIGDLEDAVDVGTALQIVEMRADMSDDDFRGAIAKVKALRKISNGGN